jgi:hypothetical protein
MLLVKLTELIELCLIHLVRQHRSKVQGRRVVVYRHRIEDMCPMFVDEGHVSIDCDYFHLVITPTKSKVLYPGRWRSHWPSAFQVFLVLCILHP